MADLAVGLRLQKAGTAKRFDSWLGCGDGGFCTGCERQLSAGIAGYGVSGFTVSAAAVFFYARRARAM